MFSKHVKEKPPFIIKLTKIQNIQLEKIHFLKYSYKEVSYKEFGKSLYFQKFLYF